MNAGGTGTTDTLVQRRIRESLVAVLGRTRSARDRSVWTTVVGGIETEFGVQLGAWVQVDELVARSSELPGGLRSIAEALDVLDPEGADTIEVTRLVDEWDLAAVLGDRDIGNLRPVLDAITDRRVLDRATRHLPGPIPRHCTTAWHVLAHLAGSNSIDGTPPWLSFLASLSAGIQAPALLRGFLDWATATWGPVTTSPDPPGGDRADPSGDSVVIKLEPHPVAPDTFLVTSWYVWHEGFWRSERGDDMTVDRAGLEAAVARIVQDVETRWSTRDGQLTIEFVLPLELLNEPIEQWRKELDSPVPVPLSVDYPVVVRSLERMRAARWHRMWRQRWVRLEDRPPGSATSQVMFASGRPDDDKFRAAARLEAALKADDDIVALVLSEPPVIGSAGQLELLAALRSGLPIVIWRRHQHDSGEIHAEVAELIDKARGPANLPVAVQRLRRVSLIDDLPSDAPLVLLWDDPTRVLVALSSEEQARER